MSRQPDCNGAAPNSMQCPCVDEINNICYASQPIYMLLNIILLVTLFLHLTRYTIVIQRSRSKGMFRNPTPVKIFLWLQFGFSTLAIFRIGSRLLAAFISPSQSSPATTNSNSPTAILNTILFALSAACASTSVLALTAVWYYNVRLPAGGLQPGMLVYRHQITGFLAAFFWMVLIVAGIPMVFPQLLMHTFFIFGLIVTSVSCVALLITELLKFQIRRTLRRMADDLGNKGQEYMLRILLQQFRVGLVGPLLSVPAVVGFLVMWNIDYTKRRMGLIFLCFVEAVVIVAIVESFLFTKRYEKPNEEDEEEVEGDVEDDEDEDPALAKDTALLLSSTSLNSDEGGQGALERLLKKKEYLRPLKSQKTPQKTPQSKSRSAIFTSKDNPVSPTARQQQQQQQQVGHADEGDEEEEEEEDIKGEEEGEEKDEDRFPAARVGRDTGGVGVIRGITGGGRLTNSIQGQRKKERHQKMMVKKERYQEQATINSAPGFSIAYSLTRSPSLSYQMSKEKEKEKEKEKDGRR